ncbi:MAG: ABC transporter permease [Myxococcota bacterium]|nr:ABC transporter permease [Myxococcota bacterium]
MSPFDILRMAFGALTNNKLRALLTSLGIIIGVASVILMIHLGQSASRSVTQTISNLGSNLIIIQPARSKRGAGGQRIRAAAFEIGDVAAIKRGIPGVMAAPAIYHGALLMYGSTARAGSIVGTDNDYFEVRSWKIAAGRKFDPAELASGAPVCILGQTIVEELYGGRQPLGTTLRLDRNSCQVIGVLEEKGNTAGNDQDDELVMPWRAVQRRFKGKDEVNIIFAGTDSPDQVPRIKSSIEILLRTRRGITGDEEDDFEVRDLQEIVQTLEQVTLTLTALLGAIAAISLLVGSIGIMNIMLVSVTERTREIGVRLAIGATARDVQIQFLVEASVLSAIGGVIGIAVGLGATWVIATVLDLPLVISYPAVFISVGFSALIGIVFGFVPARKAAHLNPIEALRHE